MKDEALVAAQEPEHRYVASITAGDVGVVAETRLIVRCEGCGEILGDADDFLYVATRKMADVLGQPLGLVFTAAKTTGPARKARPRSLQSRVWVGVDTYTVLLERPTVKAVPPVLPLVCTTHGGMTVARSELVARAAAARRDLRARTLRVSPPSKP